MSMIADLRILYYLAFAPVWGETHSERLESFYRGQAAGYDAFRGSLLKGRNALIDKLHVPEAGVWVDLGGGTASNLEAAADWLPRCSSVHVIDLSPSLLDVARERIARHGWNNVQLVEADALEFRPPGPVDLVTFSYSLTMIPDWFAAVEQAWHMLAPGGLIGVVDFFVSRKHVEAGRVRHSWFTRNLLPAWFGCDNVYLNADHVPFLQRRFDVIHYSEHLASIPYVPLIRAPYYLFVGRKVGSHPS